MRTFLALAAGCALALSSSACAGAPPRSALAKRVDDALWHSLGGGRSKATVAVAYVDLGTGETFLRNERVRAHAASTMKVPVMLALFQAVDRRELALDRAIPVRNEFKSIVDGSPYTLDPKQDGDPELYQAVGSTRTLDELIRRMIDKSSNLATNLLIDLIGASRVTDEMRLLDANEIQVLRGVEDQKAFDAGFNNIVTAYDLMLVMKAIASGQSASKASNERMVEILKAQEFNEKIPAGLPPGTPVAHKTGDITGVHHDAAIVYPPGKSPYVLVVLTTGFADDKVANGVIAAISRAVWEGR
ncbi:MAG TPA: serine hydrolase [Thermoanaerobaculia bacterium]|nr:serine hydrolase [Thermoanaerobaculia bacterium]